MMFPPLLLSTQIALPPVAAQKCWALQNPSPVQGGIVAGGGYLQISNRQVPFSEEVGGEVFGSCTRAFGGRIDRGIGGGQKRRVGRV